MPCCFISTFAKSQFPLPRPNHFFFINFALNANTAKFMLILPPHDPDLENVCYLLIFFENESRMNFYITFSILYKTKLKLQKLVKIKTLWRGEKKWNTISTCFDVYLLTTIFVAFTENLYFCFRKYFLDCTRVAVSEPISN